LRSIIILTKISKTLTMSTLSLKERLPERFNNAHRIVKFRTLRSSNRVNSWRRTKSSKNICPTHWWVIWWPSSTNRRRRTLQISKLVSKQLTRSVLKKWSSTIVRLNKLLLFIKWNLESFQKLRKNFWKKSSRGTVLTTKPRGESMLRRTLRKLSRRYETSTKKAGPILVVLTSKSVGSKWTLSRKRDEIGRAKWKKLARRLQKRGLSKKGLPRSREKKRL